jgi:16S rRNA (adenine1518-N6/adenine1519-N6)-dimethyltransferase
MTARPLEADRLSRRSARRGRRRFGQHFLEKQWIDKVVRAIGPARPDVFVEIGPGRGALTGRLASAVSHVIAVEIDRDLADDLRAAALPRVTVLADDFLEITPASLREALSHVRLPAGGIRIAGNLPYNAASPILFKLIALSDEGFLIADATVMLQREVADRVLARPGTRDYGVLTVLIRHRAHVERLLDLPAGAFRPVPKVRSTLIRLRFHPPDPVPANPAAFEALVQSLFTRRRKTLTNALMAYEADAVARSRALRAAAIDGARRPETLDLPELVRLSNAIESGGPA